jgi:hypothetical protein
MPKVSSLLKQLKQERDRVANQLSGMDAALRAFAGVYVESTNGKRQISKAGRKRIAAALYNSGQMSVISLEQSGRPGHCRICGHVGCDSRARSRHHSLGRFQR